MSGIAWTLNGDECHFSPKLREWLQPPVGEGMVKNPNRRKTTTSSARKERIWPGGLVNSFLFNDSVVDPLSPSGRILLLAGNRMDGMEWKIVEGRARRNRPNRIRFTLNKAETTTRRGLQPSGGYGRHKLENRYAESFPASNSEPALWRDKLQLATNSMRGGFNRIGYGIGVHDSVS